MTQTYNIFSDVTTNSTSTFQVIDRAGRYIVEAEGTFGGATVTFTAKGAQKAASISLADVGGTAISLTANGQKITEIPKGEQIAGTVASASGTTNVSATLRRLGDVG